MKERPILFSAAMVRAILDGRKTQTRRVVRIDGLDFQGGGPKEGFPCPYGTSGDQLWVRETWRRHGDGPLSEATGPKDIDFAADSNEFRRGMFKWRSSMFMPRWASRITLEVTGVRVQRVRDISAKDIIAEGAVLRAHDDKFGHNPVSAFDEKCYLDLLSLWAAGWDSINAKRGHGWAMNPWVWVIEFRRPA